MLTFTGNIAAARGLSGDDRFLVHDLAQAWQEHYEGNMRRHAYYEMHNALIDLGISIPPSLKNLNAACGWGAKVVDVMAERSVFDGYAVDNSDAGATLDRVVQHNKLKTLYGKATISALEQSFNLYFVTKEESGQARVRPYPANLCGALWDSAEHRLKAALLVIDIQPDKSGAYLPTWCDVVREDYVIQLRRDDRGWYAQYIPHGLNHLPVFVAAHKSTLDRPFGQSRITREIMGYIDSAVRANLNEEIAAAFAASTQKYLLGTDGDPFEHKSRWQAYIGSIFNIDMTEDGTIPQFGQLPQPSMEPMTAHFRNLCAKMSAATGIHVSQFGIVHDQPASAEAIYAENDPLILKVKTWNKDVSDTLTDVAIACLATERDTDFDTIEREGYNILPRFMNPTMPTQAQLADSTIKIASVVEGYSKTPTFWHNLGFDDAQTKTVLDELAQVGNEAATQAAISAIFSGGQSATVTNDGNTD